MSVYEPWRPVNGIAVPTGGGARRRCAKSARETTIPPSGIAAPDCVATSAIIGRPCIGMPFGRQSGSSIVVRAPSSTGISASSRSANASPCRAFDSVNERMNTTVATAIATPATAQICRVFMAAQP